MSTDDYEVVDYGGEPEDRELALRERYTALLAALDTLATVEGTCQICGREIGNPPNHHPTCFVGRLHAILRQHRESDNA